MKPILYVFLITLISACQLLKEPAAKVLRSKLKEAEAFPQDTNKYEAASYDIQITDLNDHTSEFADLKGKVIFLDLWATWCAPCVAELPSIERLYEHFKNEKDIAFVLISNEELEKVKRYVERKSLQAPYYLTNPENPVPEVYRTNFIPATYIISKNGEIRYKKVGAEIWDSESFISFLEQLLEE